MGLVAFWRKITYRTPDDTDYNALNKVAGEATPGWDNRAVIDGWPPTQPQYGHVFDTLWQIDPNWRPR
jgi:hypothetical protein